MKVDWFQRGRDAFTEGRPRFIKDARISGKDRAAWYAGWNHQADTNNLASIPQEQRDELAAFFGELRDQIRSIP